MIIGIYRCGGREREREGGREREMERERERERARGRERRGRGKTSKIGEERMDIRDRERMNERKN